MDAIGPVPLASMILADLGCEVIRIARAPGTGQAWDEVGGGILHRNRKHVHLDLKSSKDRTSALALIERSDGLIEGFRPGVMERLGLGPQICLGVNPRLVFARMTGWGQTGPLAPRAGHDINYIAITGALHSIGAADRPPSPPLNLVGDYGGGAMFAVVGLLAALLGARTTGRGQVVDIAMTDGTSTLTSFFHAFAAVGLWNDVRGTNLLDGSKPFYRCYACAGGGHVAVGSLEPQFFDLLLKGLDIPIDRFTQHDPAGWPEMEAVFEAAFLTRTREEWDEIFRDTDACVSPVLSLSEAAAHPHNAARRTFVDVDGVTQPAPSPRFSGALTDIDPERRGLLALGEALAAWPSR